MTGLIGHRGLMLASEGASGGVLSDLITSLSPNSWLRLNDNAGTSTIQNSVSGASNGSLFNSIVSVAPTAKNTSLVSAVGLVAGDVDKCFDMASSSMVEVPGHNLSNSDGWTLFCVAQQLSAAPASSGGAITIAQLSSYVQGCPELGMIQGAGGTSRLRVMRSGQSEVGMGTLPFWPYGTKLAICLKVEAAGAAKLFVNGAKIGDSGSAPGFSYPQALGINRWGTGHYGSNASSAKYQFPGKLDELTLFTRPLTDSECVDLTAAA